MNHAFDIKIATEYDVSVAIFLNNMAFWTQKNIANERHFYDGRYWIYNSLDAFCLVFPYWTKKQIRAVIDKCEKYKLILTGNFNKKAFDRTQWYSLTDNSLNFFPLLLEQLRKDKHFSSEYQSAHMPKRAHEIDSGFKGGESLIGHINTHVPKRAHACDQKGTPIPYINTDINKDNNNNSHFLKNSAEIEQPEEPLETLITTPSNASSDDSPASGKQKAKKAKERAFMLELVEIYHEVFPDNPKHNTKVLSTDLERVLSMTIKRWPEVADGKACTKESFTKYLTHLKEYAPHFAMGEYETPSGRLRRNNLVNLARFNTVVKHTEGFYS